MATHNKTPVRPDFVYWRPQDLTIGRNTHYDDDRWEFEVHTAGQTIKAYRVDWAKFEPRQLLSPEWKPLLEELKCLIWTLHHDPREVKRIEGGSIARVTSGYRDLIPWMMENRLTSLSQIDSRASWGYAEWFRENHARARDGKKRARHVTFSTAWQALHILTQAFGQGGAMVERGFTPMKEEPYDGQSAKCIAEKYYKLRRNEKLDPIPDGVAIPLLGEAAKWVVERSEDILRLQKIWLAKVVPLSHHFKRAEAAEEELRNFVFERDPRTDKPWKCIEIPWVRQDVDYVKRKIASTDIPRRLVSDLIAACLIVIQGMTGMRASDLASLQVDETPEGALPSCIERQLSLDGLTEMFLLKGVEQKSSHFKHSWVMGGRLIGTREYPLPVVAVAVLDRLLAPYRQVAGLRDLVLSTGQSRSIAVAATNVSKANSSWLSNTQREFANNYAGVKLTKHKHQADSNQDAFRAQQWRGTFAVFVVRVNKRALGPLATHFNHVDTLMTEHGYIGNDPELLGLVDDARVNLAANTLLSLVNDTEPFAGGLATHLKNAASDLRHEMEGVDQADRLEKIRGIVVDHSLRLHFTDYGACGIAVTPLVARCHQLAGTEDASRERPNFSTRRPGICAACQNFLVRRDNLPYWKGRVSTLRSIAVDQKKEHTWRHGRELALAEQFVRVLEEEE